LASDADVVVGSAWLVEGVGEAVQFEGLANGGNGILDGSSFDLLSSSQVALSSPFDEGL